MSSYLPVQQYRQVSSEVHHAIEVTDENIADVMYEFFDGEDLHVVELGGHKAVVETDGKIRFKSSDFVFVNRNQTRHIAILAGPDFKRSMIEDRRQFS